VPLPRPQRGTATDWVGLVVSWKAEPCSSMTFRLMNTRRELKACSQHMNSTESSQSRVGRVPLQHLYCWQSTPCRRCRRSSSPPLGQHSVAGRSTNSAHDTRRPRLSCGCGQSMERPSADDHGLTVAADVPPPTENIPFSVHISLT